MMQEIGTWSTPDGARPAMLELQAGSDVDAHELPGWLGGALRGAAAGAMTGASAGPYGALIGAGVGGALGAATSAGAPSAPATSPPSTAPASSATAEKPGDAARANAIRALQQFAAAVPALVQLVAAGSPLAAESDDGNGTSNEAWSDWGTGQLEGYWSLP